MKKSRWEALMRAMKLESSEDCCEALCKAYSEKHRFYHTDKHIEAMLRHFDAAIHLAERPAELEMGIWFHDAIYNPLSKSNEADSAIWAQEFLLSCGAEKDVIARVYGLIMATQHSSEVVGNDEKLIVDIDLSILGASPEVYDEFEKNVRNEYRFVPSFIYRRKRKEVLGSFLSRNYIYNFEYFRKKFENSARDNMSRAMKVLQS